MEYLRPANLMRSLLVGFDSAWTRKKTGAVVGAFVDDTGAIRELGPPRLVRYAEVVDLITAWEIAHAPSSTLVLLDQPTIVENDTGQRPVERIVCQAVSRRRGGMQPANRGRIDMFGNDAPIWEFLSRFGGAADPFGASTPISVLETYPVLAMVSLAWTLPDLHRQTGRFPKYNPARRETFAIADWVHVCRAATATLFEEGAPQLAAWIETAASNPKPTKSDQDRVDACICLIAALHIAKGRDSLFVGNCATGYIVVPDSEALRNELAARCQELAYVASDWIRVFRLPATIPAAMGGDSKTPDRWRVCASGNASVHVEPQ